MSTAAALPRKKLPIGIQNLREIRQEGHYYVDKSGKLFYPLSRLRRFGKSRLVDSIGS